MAGEPLGGDERHEPEVHHQDRAPPAGRLGRTIRFLSIEPQFEEIDLSAWLSKVDWVIQGGESGRNARAFDLAWAKSLISQCSERGVPYFLKQLGSYVVEDGRRLSFADGHAGDWTEWPACLRVRRLPTAPEPLTASPS